MNQSSVLSVGYNLWSGEFWRKCSPNPEPRADYFWNFSCSKAITKHQNQCFFLKEKIACDTWWVSVGYHREKNNGKWNACACGLFVF
jgi:hypothetical protein